MQPRRRPADLAREAVDEVLEQQRNVGLPRAMGGGDKARANGRFEYKDRAAAAAELIPAEAAAVLAKLG